MNHTLRYSFAAAASVVVTSLLSLAGCGVVESAKYRPGNSTPPAQAPIGAVPLVTQPDPVPLSRLAKIRELNFDTGLTACVGGDFSERNKWIFKPIKHSRSLKDFEQGVEIGSWDDFTEAFDLVLREIVEPNNGLVSYRKIRGGEFLSALWERLRTQLGTLPLDVFQNEDAKKSFWVNVYNFLMIDSLRDNPSALVPVQRSGTFSKKRHNVSGNLISLDQIEYGVFRLGGRKLAHPFPSGTVPTEVDSRLHVALVCGAKGCPKLRNFAYEAEKLDSILTENVHMFMNDGIKHVSYDALNQSVRVSELFQWFSIDFDAFAGGRKPADVSQFILEGCRNDKAELEKFFGSIESFSKLGTAQRIPYDWTPNEQI